MSNEDQPHKVPWSETEFIERWLEGTLDAEHELALKNWLNEDSSNLVQLAELSFEEQTLREALCLDANLVKRGGPLQALSKWTSPRSHKVVWFGIAASLAISLLLFSLFSQQPSESPVLATVIATENLQLASNHVTVEPGQHFKLQKILIKSGSLHLALPSDVQLSLHGPLEAEFDGAMILRLYQGKLDAKVGPKGHGFTVQTDAGDVIDLGTEFGLEADRNGESRVAVFSGSVELYPKNSESSENSPITLNEGQAARFSVINGLRRWESVALAVQKAGLSSREYAGVVQHVRDNLGDEELHPFYGIVQGGMQKGALSYTDKPNPRWGSLPGDQLPEWLEGADLVRTYHQFRKRSSYTLTITLRAPAAVYVLLRRGSPVPSWLSSRFELTGAHVMAGPFMPAIRDWPGSRLGSDGLPHFPFEVWKAEAEAGQFELGPTQDSRSPHTLMYGVAIREL